MNSSDPSTELLQFGVSVNVNDETRRCVEAETKEIEARFNVLTTDAAAEEKVKQELEKSTIRQESEISAMHREAKDNFESSQMKEGVLAQLKGTFDNDIMNKDENEELNTESEAVRHTIAFQEALVAKGDQSTKIEEIAKDTIRETEEIKVKIAETREEQEIAFKTKEKDNIRVRLANAKQKTLEAEYTLKEEDERLHSLREKHTAVIARNNTLRDEITKKDEALAELKLEHAAKETAANEEFLRVEAKKDQESREVKALEEQLAQIKSKRAWVSENLEKGKKLIEKRQQEEATLAKIRNERSALFTEKSEMELKIATETSSLKQAEKTLLDSNVKKEEALALKKENDKKEEEAFPAKISQKKEELAILDQKLLESNTEFSAEEPKLQEELAAGKKSAADAQVKLLHLTDELKKKTETQENLREEIDKERTSFKDKSDQMNRQLRETQDTCDVLLKDIDQKKKSAVAATKKDHHETLRKCKVLKAAVKMLDGADKAEKELAALEPAKAEEEVEGEELEPRADEK